MNKKTQNTCINSLSKPSYADLAFTKSKHTVTLYCIEIVVHVHKAGQTGVGAGGNKLKLIFSCSDRGRGQ